MAKQLNTLPTPLPANPAASAAAVLAKVLPTLAVPTQGPMASAALWVVVKGAVTARGAMATTYAALAALPQPWPWAKGVQAVATALVPAQGAPRTWQQAQAAYRFAHGYMRGLQRNHSAIAVAPPAAKASKPAAKPAAKVPTAKVPLATTLAATPAASAPTPVPTTTAPATGAGAAPTAPQTAT